MCVPTLLLVCGVTVIVDVPDPGAGICIGLNVAGVLLCTDNVTGALKPSTTVDVIVEVALPPNGTVIVLGEALRVKTASGVILRVTLSVSVSPPPTPVTVMV